MENHTHNVEQFPLIIKVRVTRKDLKNRYNGPTSCPIYRALKRNFPHLAFMVGSTRVHAWDYSRMDNGAFPCYEYNLERKYDKKAFWRSGNSLWGRIMGGFDVVLVRR